MLGFSFNAKFEGQSLAYWLTTRGGTKWLDELVDQNRAVGPKRWYVAYPARFRIRPADLRAAVPHEIEGAICSTVHDEAMEQVPDDAWVDVEVWDQS